MFYWYYHYSMMVTKTFLCTSSKKVQPAAIMILVTPIRDGVLNRCIPHIHRICRKQTLALKTGDWGLLF